MMVSLNDISAPMSAHLLIAFTDIRKFLRISKKLNDPAATFSFMDRMAHVMQEVIGPTTGKIIKFIGDAALIVYPDADAGVRNLLAMKKAVDDYIATEGHDTTITVGVHFGEAVIGPFGPEKRIDVLGDSVNRAAMAERGDHRSDFVITPEAFRRLEPSTRQRFHKYTPPIVYFAE